MKLIYCKKCGDIYNITHKKKKCSCGKTSAVYIDNENMVYDGKSAICLGIDNNSLLVAIENQVVDGYAGRIDAYVCAMLCGSTIKLKGLNKKTDQEIKEIQTIEELAEVFSESSKLRNIWDKMLNKKRIGIRTIFYKISKILMGVKINKLKDEYLFPNLSSWQSDYTNRLLAIAKRISISVEKDYGQYWFQGLLAIAKHKYYYIKELESIENNAKLFKRFGEMFEEILEDKNGSQAKNKNNNQFL